MTGTQDVSGNSTGTVYDSKGRVSAQVDVLGNRVTYLYDALGRRTTTVYDSLGRYALSQAQKAIREHDAEKLERELQNVRKLLDPVQAAAKSAAK